MDKHDAISKLKELATDLGRNPTRTEARAFGISYYLEKFFGSFTEAKAAAGLGEVKQKSKDILQCSIASHLADHRSKKASLERSKKVLVLGDTHFPFCHLDSLNLVYAIAEATQPDVIIQVGDLYDFFAHSRFPRSLKTFNPFEEMEIGREQAKKMWETLAKLVPGAALHQLLGNHDVRPLKRIIETYPEGEPFIEFYKWYEFAGVNLQKDYRDPLIVDGVFYQHGHSSRLGAHRDHNHANTVVGHTHRGGVAYRRIAEKTLWELNAGYLGDCESKALSYTQSRVTQWTLGVGFVDEWGPRFIPFGES